MSRPRAATAHAVSPPASPARRPGPADTLRLMIDRLAGGRDAATSSPAPADHQRLGDIVLLPHQVEGARRLHRALDAFGGALLADDVGTGKTFTALAVARAYAGTRIVAPAALRGTWETACRQAGLPPADFLSYERLSAGHVPALARPPLLILDEAHHARNPATRRYRRLARLAQGVHVLLLSATPVHNRPRDLQALLALCMGEGAATLDDAALACVVVQRNGEQAGAPLPEVRRGVRHEVPAAPRILDALRALPPPVPPRDGEAATPLVALQLTRAWCSSDAALLAAIRRRLVTATALEQALQNGRHPARHDLALWSGGDDGSVQLAFPSLGAPPLVEASHAAPLLSSLEAHAEALRALRALVRGPEARDPSRFDALARILATDGAIPAVVFTHSAETASAAFAALQGRVRSALLTGRGAWIASGPVTRRELLASFAPGGDSPRPAPEARRLEVLVATDVVSEGIDLQRAATVVHLDFPWTAARLEQRVGRVRRVGSRHRTVTVHIIAPPTGGEALAHTLQLLARKAAMAARVVGMPALLGDAAPWTDVPSCVTASRTPAPGQARQLLLARLREVLAATGSAPCAPLSRRSATGTARVAYWCVPSIPSPLVLALTEVDEQPHLLAGDARQLSIEPARALSCVEHLLAHVQSMPAHAMPAHPLATVATRFGAHDDPPLPDAARHLLDAVESWCARQRAARLLALPVAQRSPAHRQLMLALDALPSAMPRGARARLAARVRQARALVMSQRGAGAEQSLLALAQRVPAPLAGARAVEAWLADVVTTIERDGHEPEAPTPHTSAPARSPCGHGHGNGGVDACVGVRIVARLVAGPDPR